MSRFSNLEFESESEGDLNAPQIVKDDHYYLEQARANFEEGDFARALRNYSKVLEFDPQNAVAWTGQVRALIELEEYHEAKVWADKALERFPQEPELLASKAVALGREGDLEAALAFSDAAVEERGDTPYIWLARGDVLLARREQRADYCFEKALALAPNNWFIHWLAARIRLFYRQFAQALQLAQQGLAWNPGASMLWLLAGQCQRELGLLRPAQVSFTQACQLDPDLREAKTALWTLSQVGLGTRVRGWCRGLFHK